MQHLAGLLLNDDGKDEHHLDGVQFHWTLLSLW